MSVHTKNPRLEKRPQTTDPSHGVYMGSFLAKTAIRVKKFLEVVAKLMKI
jgi:hypothetical protein